jgi:hypothetical protein
MREEPIVPEVEIIHAARHYRWFQIIASGRFSLSSAGV